MVLPSKRPAWIALGSTLVFHILLLSLQANHRGGPGFMRLWLLAALVPLEKLVDYSAQGVSGVWDGYIALVDVREDNQTLQAENERLKMQLRVQEEAIKEAERLRKIYSLEESGIGKWVVARVIGRDPSRSFQTVTINKGSSSGVKENASVVTPDGVVGHVRSVGSSSAVVQLITDAQSHTGVMLRESRVHGVFKGTGGKELELDYIERDDEIAEGNELVASGQDRIHLKGYPVATVTSVKTAPGLFKAVVARPSADFARLEEVMVITEPAAPPAEEPPNSPTSLPSD
jgi:rod shape-determining protein MreC